MSLFPPPTAMPYSEREDWADVTPIPQHDGNATPMAPIYYTAEYKDATDYFRGIVRMGEQSERALALTEHIISLNPGHYTVWQYRYRTLQALRSDLGAELALMDEVALRHMKTYQVWHHRRLLVAQRDAAAAAHELAFTARVLRADAKNYHTWAFRQWVLAHFNAPPLWAGERAFAEDMLADDVRNNSAWHHRFFVVWDAGVREGDEDRGVVLRRELAFTKEKISLAPNNESAWNYLRGILARAGAPFATVRSFVEPYALPHPDAKNTRDADVVDLDDPPPTETAQLPCRFAIEFLADIHEREGDATAAAELFRTLAETHDKIRKRYWDFRAREALKSAPGAEAHPASAQEPAT